jgi:hypothetical protein
MEITLEKVELIKDRTGVSYKEAKEALEAADGNTVDAIIHIEETINMSNQTKLTEQGTQLMEKVKEVVKKGHVSRIVIKRDDEILLNLPGTIAAAGTVLAPFAAMAGVVAAFGTKCRIEIVKDDGEVIDLNEKAEGAFSDAVAKGSNIAGNVVEKGTAAVGSVRNKAQEAIGKTRRTSRVKDDDFKDTVDEMWEEARNKVRNAKAEAEAASAADSGEDNGGEDGAPSEQASDE